CQQGDDAVEIAVGIGRQRRFAALGQLAPRGAAAVDELLRRNVLQELPGQCLIQPLFSVIMKLVVGVVLLQPLPRLLHRVAVGDAIECDHGGFLLCLCACPVQSPSSWRMSSCSLAMTSGSVILREFSSRMKNRSSTRSPSVAMRAFCSWMPWSTKILPMEARMPGW